MSGFAKTKIKQNKKSHSYLSSEFYCQDHFSLFNRLKLLWAKNGSAAVKQLKARGAPICFINSKFRYSHLDLLCETEVGLGRLLGNIFVRILSTDKLRVQSLLIFRTGLALNS